jgi:mycothiol synthase
MTHTLPSTYTWRPLAYEDLPALHQLALSLVEPEDSVDSLADLQSTYDDPWSNAALDSRVGFDAQGKMIAFARCFLAPEPTREAAAWLWLDIDAGHRTPALEDALLGWLVARSRERLQAAPAHLAQSLRIGCSDTRQADIDLYQRHGFQPHRYFYRMRRELHQPLPEGALPDGIQLYTYNPSLDQAMLDVFDTSFRDHWGFEPIDREEWQQFYTGSEAFRPDLSLLALAGDEPVGMLLSNVDAADNARTGRQEGLIKDVGVLRAWRKRGVATALIAEAMRRYRASGLDSARLGVDTANPTGALGIYERLGFVPVHRFVVHALETRKA